MKCVYCVLFEGKTNCEWVLSTSIFCCTLHYFYVLSLWRLHGHNIFYTSQCFTWIVFLRHLFANCPMPFISKFQNVNKLFLLLISWQAMQWQYFLGSLLTQTTDNRTQAAASCLIFPHVVFYDLLHSINVKEIYTNLARVKSVTDTVLLHSVK